MAVSATGYVQRQAFGAARSDWGDRRASLIRPSMQKRKLVLDFERGRERQMDVEASSMTKSNQEMAGGVSVRLESSGRYQS